MPRPVRPQPTPGEVIIVLAGAGTLLFSFIDWANGTNAWGKGAFPIATLVPIYGVLMAAQVVADLAGVDMPRDLVAGFTWPQLHVAFGLMAGLLSIAFVITNVTDKQAGLWLQVIGGLALAVGSVMLQHERRTDQTR
jgi:hypothetical protein